MEHAIEKAQVLIEALPYIRDFQGKTVVIKYGGAAMIDPELRRSTAEDIVLMKYVGMCPVVVHGGGPEINRMLDRLEIPRAFNNQGLRITDKATVEVVEMMLAGTVNKDIVRLLNNAGGQAVGISGADGRLLYAEKMPTEDGSDIGYVGRITGVHPKVIGVLTEADFIPVISPLGTDTQGNTWNINADTAAGEIAASLQAEKLVFLTDTPGLLEKKDDPGTLIHQLRSSDVDRLKASGVIAGGMIPKLQACQTALDYGVRKTHIIDGRVPHALLLEIFTSSGLGTLVTG
jgi:acetylglutamate kinase